MTKILGGIFLIIGTAIGAGILALPVTTATSGFFPSALLLIFCWILMTFNALLILEVNLWLPPNSNIISMARATLGRVGEVVAWISYCLLLYALLSAYIAAATDLFDSFTQTGVKYFFDQSDQFDCVAPLCSKNTVFIMTAIHWIDTLLLVGLLGFVVYRGTKSIDYLNRGLIITKITAFILLLVFIAPFVEMPNLFLGQSRYLISTLMVIITSFGFAIIIPSLRMYFDSDVKKLRIVIIVGSLIPLICYLIWILVILGSLPLEGSHGLRQVLGSGHAASELIIALNQLVHSHSLSFVSKIFGIICVITSFLGLSLSLSDFLADGFHLQKRGKEGFIIAVLTFLPSLLIVLFYPSIFIKALHYAGTLCAILLILLPGLMAWRGRYQLNKMADYRVPGGKLALILSLCATLVVLAVGVGQEFF